jgi:hypothetical protein
MSFFGIPRGRNKAAATVRLVIINTNPTNNAQLYLDSASPTTVTYRNTGWLQLFSSLPNVVNALEIFDSTGFTARVATGAPSSEVDLLLNVPGGNGFIPVKIDAGERLAIRPVTNPDVGTEFVLNLYD